MLAAIALGGTTMLKKMAYGALALVLTLILMIGVNTLRHGSRQMVVPPAPLLSLDTDAAAQRLAAAVRLRTVSHDGQDGASAAEFQKLHVLLEKSFPRVHAGLRREVVGGHSLLYTWPGSDPKAKPILLMAHQDVVPIAPGTEKDWQADPFGGEIRDGFIWGRGAWDDKANLVGIFEAVEMLLAAGHQPRQTVYIASGHDEEIGGESGAMAIVALLKERGVRLDFVLDEGLLITEGVLKGLDAPVALIGTAEKGYLTLALTATATPGHSSMPGPETAIGMLSAALTRLEERQMPAAFRGVAQELFDTIAPEMTGLNRVLLSNLWLFGPVVKAQLERSASTNAMLRTTTALTVVQAGNKENVLPGRAEALVNFRLLPGDTVEGVTAHVQNATANDKIAVRRAGKTPSESSPISPTASPSYQLINRTIRELFPGTVVAPGLMIGATDARHFLGIADAVYRFSPVRARPEDLPRFHGTNERISVTNYGELIRFYHRLLSNAVAR
jgi:carboxypeptidase PM20D1